MSEDVPNRGTEHRPAERPAILETGRGPTVVHNGRALYSRRDPSRDPIKTVAALAIPDETLVLCVSPLLGYGLDLLLEKLPPHGLALALECDEDLMALSVSAIDESILAHGRFRYIRTSSSERVIEYVDALGLPPFRRCVRVDLSAGASLNPTFYAATTRLIDDYISRSWRNHVTLMRLGRSYARDFFANLPSLCGTQSASLCGTHTGAIARGMARKPVLVAGAGPSLDDALAFIKANRDGMFILAVDTALGTFAQSGIACDAVIVVESQFWIERAFAGLRDSRIPVFADLTARPAAVRACAGDVGFFLSEYARTRFINRFLAAMPAVPVIPPLGSVGLAALWLARHISAPDARVLVTGLDFSFGKGLTHTRGAPASLDAYSRASRVSPPGSSVPSLAENAHETRGKDGAVVYTDQLLSGYASLCGSFFSGMENAFMDIGRTGLETGLARATYAEASSYLAEYAGTHGGEAGADSIADASGLAGERGHIGEGIDAGAVRRLLREELDCLDLARRIMTGEISEADSGNTLDEILRERDYLFLHFPDGYRGYSADASFLRRVRVEIDYFMKTIANALADF